MIRAIFLHAEVAKSAEFLFPLVYHACAEGVANFVTTRVRKAVIQLNLFNPLILLNL